MQVLISGLLRARLTAPLTDSAGSLRARVATMTFPLSQCEEDELRRQVREYASELKQLGLPPERVLVAMKCAANDAGIRQCSSVVPSRRSLDARTNLLTEIVGWCIAGYYDVPDRDA